MRSEAEADAREEAAVSSLSLAANADAERQRSGTSVAISGFADQTTQNVAAWTSEIDKKRVELWLCSYSTLMTRLQRHSLGPAKVSAIEAGMRAKGYASMLDERVNSLSQG